MLSIMKGIIKGAGTVIATAGVVTAGVAVDKISGAHGNRRKALLEQAQEDVVHGVTCCDCKRELLEGDKIYLKDNTNYEEKGYRCKSCHDDYEAGFYCCGG